MKMNLWLVRVFLVPIFALSLLDLQSRAAQDATPGGWDKVKGKRVLYFTKSSGFEHSVVKRPSPDQLSHSEKILTELGQKHGFEVTCTKDGGVFTPGNLAKYSVIVFYTSDNLLVAGTDQQPPMTPAGKTALLDAVKNGKGFVALHAANDSFHHQPDDRFVSFGAQVDPYIAMLGGEFIRHGPQQVATCRVVDKKFPGCESLDGSIQLLDEWYTFKDFTKDMHVILALETKGMQGVDYQRAPFPNTWARAQGKGRVFYTGLGHREDVWTNPLFQNLLLGGLGWAAGNVDAVIPSNIETATPGYREIQPKDEPKKP